MSEAALQNVLKQINSLPGEEYGPFMGGLRSGAYGEMGNLASLAAALGVPNAQDFAARMRTKADEIARATSGVKEFSDVGGPGDLWDYAKFLAGQSALPAAEVMVPAVGMGMRGAGLAGRAATLAVAPKGLELAAEIAARRAPGVLERAIPGDIVRGALTDAGTNLATREGAYIGAFAGGLPSAAGDIAQNQYDEAGQYNLPAIAAGAIPYSALNLIGPEGMLVRGATGAGFLPRAIAGVSERAGWRGAAERAALGLGVGGVVEGAGETGQEIINQAGRLAVSPTASMTSPDALHRYFESFMGGMTLGGMGGGVGGAFTKPAMKALPDMAERVDSMRRASEDLSQGLKLEVEARADVEQAAVERDAEMEAAATAQMKAYEESLKTTEQTKKEVVTADAAFIKAATAEADKIEEIPTRVAVRGLIAKFGAADLSTRATMLQEWDAEEQKSDPKVKAAEAIKLARAQVPAPPETTWEDARAATHNKLWGTSGSPEDQQLAVLRQNLLNRAPPLDTRMQMWQQRLPKLPNPLDTLPPATPAPTGVPATKLQALAASLLSQPMGTTLEQEQQARRERELTLRRQDEFDAAEQERRIEARSAHERLVDEQITRDEIAKRDAEAAARPAFELAPSGEVAPTYGGGPIESDLTNAHVQLGVLAAKQKPTRADITQMARLREHIARLKAEGDATAAGSLLERGTQPAFELTPPVEPPPAPAFARRATDNIHPDGLVAAMTQAPPLEPGEKGQDAFTFNQRKEAQRGNRTKRDTATAERAGEQKAAAPAEEKVKVPGFGTAKKKRVIPGFGTATKINAEEQNAISKSGPAGMDAQKPSRHSDKVGKGNAEGGAAAARAAPAEAAAPEAAPAPAAEAPAPDAGESGTVEFPAGAVKDTPEQEARLREAYDAANAIAKNLRRGAASPEYDAAWQAVQDLKETIRQEKADAAATEPVAEAPVAEAPAAAEAAAPAAAVEPVAAEKTTKRKVRGATSPVGDLKQSLATSRASLVELEKQLSAADEAFEFEAAQKLESLVASKRERIADLEQELRMQSVPPEQRAAAAKKITGAFESALAAEDNALIGNPDDVMNQPDTMSLDDVEAMEAAQDDIDRYTTVAGEPRLWVRDAVSAPGATAESVLQAVIDKSGNPAFKDLAKHLLALGFGDVKFVYDPTIRREGNKRVFGKYDPKTNTITIYQGGEYAEAPLHEAVHAATLRRIGEAERLAASGKTDLSPDQRQLLDAYNRLHRLLAEVKAAMSAEELSLYQLDGNFALDEFVTRAFTNEKFQRRLREIQSAEKKLEPSKWVDFVNGVKRLLGLGDNNGSVLARIMETIPEFVVKPGGSMRQGELFLAAVESTSQLPANVAKMGWTMFGPGGLVERTVNTAPEGMRETLRKGAEMVRKGVAHVDTVRYIASRSYGYTTIYQLVADYNTIKRLYQNVLNEKLAGFANLNTADRAKIGELLIATTLNKMRAVDVSEYARVANRDTDVAIMSADGLSFIAAPALAKLGKYSRAEFTAGVKDGAGNNLPVPDEKLYGVYVNTMQAMQDGAAALYGMAERTAKERGRESSRIATRGLDDNAKADIDKLRAAMIAYARKDEHNALEKETRTLKPLSEAARKTLKELDSNIHGLLNAPTAITAVQVKQLSDTLELTVDEVTNIGNRVNSQITTEKPQRVRALTNSIMMSGLEQSLLLSERLDAIKSIVGGYVPFKRRGQFMVDVYYVDAKGRKIKASDIETVFNAALPIWMDDDQTWMRKTRDVIAAEYAKVPELKIRLKGSDEDVTVRIEVGEVVGTKQTPSVSDRIDYVTIMNALDRLGIVLSFDQRESFIRSTTAADSAVRAHMFREGRPGVDKDFMTSISEDLSRRAALIAMRSIAPKIEAVLQDELLNPETGEMKYWGQGTTAIAEAQAAYDAAVKSSNKNMVDVTKRTLAGTKRMYSGQTKLNVQIMRKAAHEYATWFMGEGVYEDDTFASQVRSVVTIAQLGLSFASAFTNMTSLPLHALSGLATYNNKTGFGGGFGEIAASGAIIKAVKTLMPVLRQASAQILPGTDVFLPQTWIRDQIEKARTAADGKAGGYDVATWQFMLKETEQGVTAPQRYNALMGYANKKVYGTKADEYMGKMMALFSATEEVNRMATLLASYELFSKRATDAKIDNKIVDQDTMDTAWERYVHAASIQMVYDTQGEYSQANRPKHFRNGIMSMAFMYKTFAVTTMELIANLPPRGRLLFLGMLHTFSGAQGIPLFEELMTVFDTVAQKTGLGLGLTKGNAERELDLFLKRWGHDLGVPLDRLVMHGIFDTLLGTKVFGRAGVNVGIPLIGIGRAGTDIEKELGKALGAPVGAASGLLKAASALLKGDVERALREQPVTGVRNLTDAYFYSKYDNVLNRRGQVVMKDPSVVDISARALGFYPEAFGSANDFVRLEEYTRAFSKEMSNQFVEEYRRYRVLHDLEGMRGVRDAVREHNETFKGTALEIFDFGKKAEAAGKSAELTLTARELKSLPKGQRAEAKLLAGD